MKKMTGLTAILLLFAVSMFAQVSRGDVELIQKTFGMEKAALIKEYMELTPKQDSAFWPVYNRYENERKALGLQRISLIDEYMKSIENTSVENATRLVDKGVALEINFKRLQKKYFTEMAKKIGPVKAAQFYQFENYLNNLVNINIQENIPFIGELSGKAGKK